MYGELHVRKRLRPQRKAISCRTINYFAKEEAVVNQAVKLPGGGCGSAGSGFGIGVEAGFWGRGFLGSSKSMKRKMSLSIKKPFF